MGSSPVLNVTTTLVYIVAITIAISGFAGQSPPVAAIGVGTWLYGSILLQILGRIRSLAYLFFLAMFAFFLFNGIVIASLTQRRSPLDAFSTETQLHVLATLLISLAAIDLGRRLIRRPRDTQQSSNLGDTSRRMAARRAAGFLFLCTAPLALTSEIERALFVGATDYFSLYTSFNSALPRVFQQASLAFGVAYAVLLAMRPARKIVLAAAAIYLVVNAVSFAAGQRNPLMLGLLLTVFYLWVRERESSIKGTWLPRRAVILGIIALPGLLVALQLLKYARLGSSVRLTSPLEEIVNLLQEQATTLAVIGYGYDYSSALDQFGPYLLTPVWNAFSGNALINMFVNIPQYVPQTPEYATNARVFGQTLTYLVTPTSYAGGYGLGSSYLAESYQDLGYVGVVLVSLLVGALIGLCDRAPGAKSWSLLVVLLVAPRVWFAPRAGAFDFVYDLITPTPTIVLAGIWIYASLSGKRNRGRRLSDFSLPSRPAQGLAL